MRVQLFNRQRALPLDFARLSLLAAAAPFACLPCQGKGNAALQDLRSIEVSIISDRAIARVHKEFLGVAGATDVITFDHGEILVSATTAHRRAQQEGEAYNRELFRYVVHGLLHLNGHRDKNAEDAAAMWQAQEEIVRALWPQTRKI